MTNTQLLMDLISTTKSVITAISNQHDEDAQCYLDNLEVLTMWLKNKTLKKIAEDASHQYAEGEDQFAIRHLKHLSASADRLIGRI